jgi:hypothetical protein
MFWLKVSLLLLAYVVTVSRLTSLKDVKRWSGKWALVWAAHTCLATSIIVGIVVEYTTGIQAEGTKQQAYDLKKQVDDLNQQLADNREEARQQNYAMQSRLDRSSADISRLTKQNMELVTKAAALEYGQRKIGKQTRANAGIGSWKILSNRREGIASNVFVDQRTGEELRIGPGVRMHVTIYQGDRPNFIKLSYGEGGFFILKDTRPETPKEAQFDRQSDPINIGLFKESSIRVYADADCLLIASFEAPDQ